MRRGRARLIEKLGDLAFDPAPPEIHTDNLPLTVDQDRFWDLNHSEGLGHWTLNSLAVRDLRPGDAVDREPGLLLLRGAKVAINSDDLETLALELLVCFSKVGYLVNERAAPA